MASTIKTLQKMTDKELANYFYRNARHFGERNYKYGIRLGGRMIWADDTLDLRKKFLAAVRTSGNETSLL